MEEEPGSGDRKGPVWLIGAGCGESLEQGCAWGAFCWVPLPFQPYHQSVDLPSGDCAVKQS